MCGQFGLLTVASTHEADDFLANAFVTSMLRGEDSSGIASIDTNTLEYNLHKLPVNGMYFAGDRITKKLMRWACAANQLTLCHVRAATVGEVSISNAHPFEVERDDFTLVGTHNGTLTGWSYKASAKGFTVDSEWALNLIADQGINAFKELNGAYSFVWWQGNRPGYLFMARNKERPMCVAFLDNGGMAYASEAGMLYWLLERNNVKMDGPILFLDDGYLYSFPVDEPKNFLKEKLPESTTWGTSGHYARTRNYTTTITVVEGMKSLIEKAGRDPANDPFPAVYESEKSKAREYGWYDEEAEFIADKLNPAGNTEGMAAVLGHDFDAIIRGDMLATHSANDIWRCRVLGVQEEGKKLKLVLSKPYKTVSQIEEPSN